MGYLDHVAVCNSHDASRFVPFRIDGRVVGRIRHDFADQLAGWPDLFQVDCRAVTLSDKLQGVEQRSAGIAEVMTHLVAQGDLSHLHGEQYAVTAEGGSAPLLLLDRAVAPRFGIRAFGQHVNGYVRTPKGLSMWVGRRADDRRHYPGFLDNMAAGGLPHGISLTDNLAKECWEEAGIPLELASRAVPVGAVTYHMDTEIGFKPDTLYCYDLEIPEAFVPRCKDGEVQAFYLMPVEEVMHLVRETDRFKLNCNLVIMDFLIRHGYIGPEDESYIPLLTGLHPALPPLE